MRKRASYTALGPMVQMAVEQFYGRTERIASDETALALLPLPLRALLALFRLKVVREGAIRLMDKRLPGVRGGLICRKRYIDDVLADALAAGIDAVVIFGSGFDTRAYRLPPFAPPAVMVYEMDFPYNLEAKKKAVRLLPGRQRAPVRHVPIDFDSDEIGGALRRAGYAATKRSLFIIEGVTQYVTPEAFQRIMGFLGTAEGGSRLVFTYIVKDFIDGENDYRLGALYRQVRVKRRTWRLGLSPDTIQALLSRYGWKLVEDVGPAEYQARYILPTGRNVPVMEIERAAAAIKLG